MAKLVSIPANTHKKIKPHRLSKSMIHTLSEAYERQKAGIVFGPYDIRGSFMALFNKKLISVESISVEGEIEYMWIVTEEGIELLNSMGKIVDGKFKTA